MKQLFALTAALAVFSAAFAAAPANAQTFRELMEDIGVQKREQPKIDFSERAPLVLPPDEQALPPPEDASALAGVNPNWPRDVDVQAEIDAEENERVSRIQDKAYRRNPAGQIYEIRRKEREEGNSYDPSTAVDDTYLGRRDMRLSPGELKEVRDKRAQEASDAGPVVYVEPERKRLTDPPSGYRSPSPAQPYGPDEKEKKRKEGWFSKLNPFD